MDAVHRNYVYFMFVLCSQHKTVIDVVQYSTTPPQNTTPFRVEFENMTDICQPRLSDEAAIIISPCLARIPTSSTPLQFVVFQFSIK